jgi:cell division protein FtsW
MWALTLVLVLFGLVMVLSASSVQALHDRHIGTPWYYFGKQSLLAAVGFVSTFVVSRMNYHSWRRFIPLLFVLACAATLMTFVPGIGRTVNGASSWVSIGPVQGQPSELLKLAVLVYCADLLARRADRMHEPNATMGPVLIMTAMACAIVVLQKDLGTAIVLASIALAMLFVAGSPLRPLCAATGGLVAMAGAVVMSESYRRARITCFLHPGDALCYQVAQARISFSTGGLTGVGLGESRGKWGYLPEAHTDFISAIVGEELGLLGFVAMISLLTAFVLVGARISMRAPDRFGMLLAGGVTGWVSVQVGINLGAAVGLLPITGLPLPFISFGPSSLVCLMLGTGLLLSVARRSRR